MLTTIPAATVRELVRLSKRKQRLMAEIQELDRRMLHALRHFDALKTGVGTHRPRVVVSGKGARPGKKS